MYLFLLKHLPEWLVKCGNVVATQPILSHTVPEPLEGARLNLRDSIPIQVDLP